MSINQKQRFDCSSLWVGLLLPLVLTGCHLYEEKINHQGKIMNISRKNYAELQQPVGPYVHAVKHNGTLYLSGLAAVDEKALAGTIEEQAIDIFKQINSIAKAEGSSLENLLKVTIYVTDLNDMQMLRETLFKIYGEKLPASALVEVNALFAPEIKIEVAAVLAVN